MCIRIFLLIAFLAVGLKPAAAHPGDSPETLEWVKRTADKIELSLSSATKSMDWADLLIKLMQSHDEFEAVALAGLYCHEVRKAAELGRFYCNWLNNSTLDKDLNTCIIRATEARLQAIRMREAAEICLMEARQNPPDTTFILSDLLRTNAEAIEHDIADGLASEDFHILSQKLEHAERIFHNTEILSATLLDCSEVTLAAKEGSRACMDALLSKEWGNAIRHVQSASAEARKIKSRAGKCK
ncbi:MAG: hypothetical protein OHK0019_06480 [Saprospiraceae bacterium]